MAQGQSEGLRVEDVTHRFGGLLALQHVSFAAARGQITGLIGPNGSGKTTMFNIISGFIRPNAGRIFIDGDEITSLPPHRMTARGIGRTFQIPKPFASMTVRHTVELAARINRAGGDPVAVAREVGLGEKLDLRPGQLTTTDLHSLELAKVLATGTRFVLLDEVFAGLNPTEIEVVAGLIRRVADRGISFLIIEHRMRAVMALCQQVHVLLYGRLAISGTPTEVTRDPEVIEAYLGEEVVHHA
jgi:branched-chain amino acid transport system ATP-binding protein